MQSSFLLQATTWHRECTSKRVMRYHSIVSVIVLGLLLATPGFSNGQIDEPETTHPDAVCPAPVSTCGDDTASLADCPQGFHCTCVPSCPNCRDCAARVCIADPVRQCRTACDCDPGLGCFDGQCIAGFAPVYCCEADRCPPGQQCQHKDGPMDRCPVPPECRTACDCDPGLGCFDGQCIAGIAPVYCCEADRCPPGQQCQHKDGPMDRCPAPPECRTACDCDPGLGCFDGQCIAGFAPVFCCDGRQCPVGEQCQRHDGSMDRCGAVCTTEVWRCETPGQNDTCTDGRICSCTASCPLCEDCGPGVCVPPGVPTPYRCDTDRPCQPGDRCVCVSSCPECDDCVATVCVHACDDPTCEKRQKKVARVTAAIVERAARCSRNEQCVRIDTSTECQGTCGAWVNRHYAPRVERYLDRIDKRYCASYREDGCTFITPRCHNEVAACVEGQCVGIVPSLPSAADE